MRAIPSIERLRQRDAVRALEAQYGRPAVVDALRAEAAIARTGTAGGSSEHTAAAIEAGVAVRLLADGAPSLRRVINATGVIIHTNLGRAPLAPSAIARIEALAGGYTNLEYDLDAGTRGRRDAHAARLLARLTGAPAACVVNNNAAATLVVLAAMAAGREVIISRGELVEIGGGFRVPDVMAQSGAVLREVGTTNRTRVSDYAAAIGDRTAIILRVHPSNFRIEGFTERPALADLVALGRRFNVPVVDDLGSGCLIAHRQATTAVADEPLVSDAVAAGADLVMFSGDKLFGGPQAGIIAGTEAAVSLVKAHPLMRALRVDKLTYAALEATLEDYLAGRAAARIPVVRMMTMTAAEIERRAERIAGRAFAAALQMEIIDGLSTIGGGSAPGSALPTRLIAVSHASLGAAALERRLRLHQPPVVARVEHARVLIDLRTVDPADDDTIAAALGSL